MGISMLKQSEELCRWLAWAALKETYAENEDALAEGMQLLCDDLKSAFETGVQVGTPLRPVTLRLGVTGVKGDWPFLIASGFLQRHFRRQAKRGQSQMEAGAGGVCHLCMAGTAGFPYTDVGSAPAFEQTMGSAAVPCLRKRKINVFKMF